MSYGTLTDYATGEQIRPATAAEWRKTADLVNGGKPGGHTGAWEDEDGRAVWVDGGPGAEVGFYSIRDLRDEAATAGDIAQVALCDTALDEDADGYDEARAECVSIILDSRLNSVEA